MIDYKCILENILNPPKNKTAVNAVIGIKITLLIRDIYNMNMTCNDTEVLLDNLLNPKKKGLL